MNEETQDWLCGVSNFGWLGLVQIDSFLPYFAVCSSICLLNALSAFSPLSGDFLANKTSVKMNYIHVLIRRHLIIFLSSTWLNKMCCPSHPSAC